MSADPSTVGAPLLQGPPQTTSLMRMQQLVAWSEVIVCEADYLMCKEVRKQPSH